MPTYRVTTTCTIYAKDHNSAKMGFCEYVSGDLGIESIDSVIDMSDEALIKEAKEGKYEPTDNYDWTEDYKFTDKLNVYYEEGVGRCDDTSEDEISRKND